MMVGTSIFRVALVMIIALIIITDGAAGVDQQQSDIINN